MLLVIRLLLCGLVLPAFPALAQVRIEDEFATGSLAFERWCPCQVNMSEAPPMFLADPDQPEDRVVQIVVDDSSLGGNVCRSGAPDSECRIPSAAPATALADTGADGDEEQEAAETLGPSFIRRSAAAMADSAAAVAQPNPYCTKKVVERAKAAGEENECIQRQELRLQKEFQHPAERPHFYNLRFRMPAAIEDREHSIRRITAQWKHEPVSATYQSEFGEDWGPSPFLAQRFDDGVLHVTVQDEHCRCMVASAPGIDGSVLPWEDGPAQYCQSTRPSEAEGQACTADFQVSYGPNPILSSPLGNWVELRYRVQASRSEPAMIEVHEGERLIVRVTGKIGYKPQDGDVSRIKFKIGHYRDYMPFVHGIEVDRVSISSAH